MRTFEHFPSLVAMFFTRAAEQGGKPFLWRKEGGTWQSLSWAETARQVAALAAALRAEGIQPGDRVMIVSENRPEFCIADLAVMAAGAVSVPTYTTNTTRDHDHILNDSGARAVIVSTARLAKPLLPAVIHSNSVRLVIGIEPLKIGQASTFALKQWDDLLAAHKDDPAADPAQCAAALTAKRNDLACLIYTSGTGGAPRGVQQHHGAILLNVEGCIDVIAGDFGWDDEVFLSFLPLSHAYEHTGGQFLPIGLGAQIYYAEGLEKLAANIEEVRPTIMVVVPRLFEVLRARVMKQIEKQGRVPMLLLMPSAAARRQAQAGGAGRAVDCRWTCCSNTTLRPRSRRASAGGSRRWFRAARRSIRTSAMFFHAMGLTLLQGYGQTEAGPVISVQPPQGGPQDGYGRPAAERRRGEDRRGWRNPRARRAGNARLLAQPR
jgi:long-chain acyl-CoA synthetase